MSQLRRSHVIWLVASFAVLAAVAALVQPYQSQLGPDPFPSLSVHSSGLGGSRALSLWLGDLGYRTSALEYAPFATDSRARLLFVLAPMGSASAATGDLTESHASSIAAWVEQGGNLVLVADRKNPLLDRLGIGVDSRRTRPKEDAQPSAPWLGPDEASPPTATADAVLLQPLSQDPPIRRVQVEANAPGLQLLRPEWIPLLGRPDRENDIVAAGSRLGQGRVFVLSARRPLSNGGLGAEDNWALAMHLLAGVPSGSPVAFDEYHHGLTEHGTLGAQLTGQPWGWAIIYSGALLFAYMALRGRRFGPALRSTAAGASRSRVEYVATLAEALRQGKHRGWLCREYAAQVKRSLATRFQLRPDLPASEFAAVLAEDRPDAAALASQLVALENAPPASEAAVVALFREVEAVRSQLLR